MEAGGAVSLHQKIINKNKDYLYVRIKDDDGTITAAVSPRLMTKEEYDSKKYHPRHV